jgi:hypothetical protein
MSPRTPRYLNRTPSIKKQPGHIITRGTLRGGGETEKGASVRTTPFLDLPDRERAGRARGFRDAPSPPSEISITMSTANQQRPVSTQREWTLAWYYVDVYREKQRSCALLRRRPSETRDTLLHPVPTRCDHVVSVPTRYSVGQPTCPDCRAILGLSAI